MQRNLENRLARAEATASATSWTDLQSAHHRCLLRVRVKICESVREYLIANSDEPERHALWRHGEEASAELANIPDTPELRAADEAILSRAHSEKDSGDARERLQKRLDGMADAMDSDSHF